MTTVSSDSECNITKVDDLIRPAGERVNDR